MTTIRLPNGWDPRSYQMPLWQYLENGGLRASFCAHRRSGKDDVALHWTACSMIDRVGTYWHMLPQASQARKAIWEAVNPHTGKRRIDEAFPKELRASTREQDMMIKFTNGSTWQVVGSDNYDSLMGSPPVGIVFSEYALSKPSAWGFLRPILLENGGWAIFISTPRGRNHFYRIHQHAESNENWFAQTLPVSESNVFSDEQRESERAEYVAEFGPDLGNALFDQEFLCSWDAAIPGSIYGSLVQQAESDGRVRPVPYDPAVPVETWWDLGVASDAMAIVFAQYVGPEIHIIDFIQGTGKSLQYYVKAVQDKPYVYSRHVWPHDGKAREMTAAPGPDGEAKSRQQVANGYGLYPEICESQHDADGINAVRLAFPRFWIDESLDDFIEALRQYRYEWDEKKSVLKPTPLKDWCSHLADAVRVGISNPPMRYHDEPPEPEDYAAESSRSAVGGY